MKDLAAIEEYQRLISSRENFLLFVKTHNCSVCEGLLPQIEAFEGEYELPFYKVNATDLPELAGQLMLFTAPVVLIFHEGKEIHRWARFVPLADLRKKLDEFEEGLHV